MKGRETRRVNVRRKQRWLIAALLAVTTVLAFAATASATTGEFSSSSTAPWIISDEADYAPGSRVHLTGGDWQPGESVQIVTNDSIGNTWSQTDNVTADANGNIADDIILPNTFIASYTVTATGALSGTATATFTDGNASSVTGTVTDSGTHAAISGASVTCNASGGCNGTFTTTTDASGNYFFDGASGHGAKLTFATNGPVTLTLTVSKAGYTNGTITLTNVSNGSTFSGKDVALTPSVQNQTTLSITGPSAATYGDSDATITTSGGSGTGALSFDAGSSTACSIVSGKLHVSSGTGTCTITATKAGDSNFNPTTSAPFNVNIHKADQATLTVASPDDGTYGDKLVPSASGGSGTGALSFTASGTACQMGSGADAGKLLITSGTGTCSVTAHQAGDNNYNSADSAAHTVNIHKADQAITFTSTPPANPVVGTTYTPTATGGDSGNPVVFSASGACSYNSGTGKVTLNNPAAACVVMADQAGNSNYNAATQVEQTFGVIYNWTGFFQPVNNWDSTAPCNVVKAGSAIPVKFSLGGYQGMNIFKSGPTATTGTCNAGTDPIDSTDTVTAGSSSLNYDSTTDQYIYVWKTDKAWAGKSIRFSFVLMDGTTHYARFNFTK